jgi:hypothetical protein
MLREPAKTRLVSGAGRQMQEQVEFTLEDESTRRSLNYYHALQSAVSGAAAELLVVYAPLSYCVHREDMSRWRHLGVADVDGQIAFNREFCACLARQGIVCVDATEDLVREAREQDERLYYWLDIHWTPKGNRVAAQSVAHHLLEGAPRLYERMEAE